MLIPLLDEVARLLGIILPTAIVAWQFARERFRLESLGPFIDRWGMLTSEYVDFAVREPEGFDAYRARRRSE